MDKVVGIKFRRKGRIMFYSPGSFVLNEGDEVLVKRDEGMALGRVVIPPKPLASDVAQQRGLDKVYRVANEEDLAQHMENVALEKRAENFCREAIERLEIPMFLSDVECLLDGSKLIFYFTADGRVDFRELVKVLVKEFRMRVELRQIGVRHKAKMIGGLGCCGRELCCATFLTEFSQVSVKMAKEQNLSLNPSKISGVCGRLMCCLRYEYETYLQHKDGFPKVGKRVETPKGYGKVVRQNVLEGSLTVSMEDGGEKSFRKEEVKLASAPVPQQKKG